MHASELKAIAYEQGASLCGIAPVERFKNAPSGFHPLDIYPNCKSVAVLANPSLIGSMVSSLPVPYTFSCHTELKQMDFIVLQTALALEMAGIGVVPVPPDDPYLFWEESRTEGRGILSLRHAAHLAGLGVLGMNTLLKNKEYGNMIRLGALLVDVELEGDSIVTEPACPENCRICIDACPSGALDGKTVDQSRCRLNTYTTNKRGHSLIQCHICREVCPHHFGEKRQALKRRIA